jgi:hypothetical protein
MGDGRAEGQECLERRCQPDKRVAEQHEDREHSGQM